MISSHSPQHTPGKMVSKFTKRTPTKSIKSRNRRRNRTPVKADVAAALAAFNRTCRRRLAKLFSKLARVSATPTKTRRKHCYQLVHKDSNSPIKSTQFEKKAAKLPPQNSPKKPTVVLDLDETLVHTTPVPPPGRFDFIVRPRIGGEMVSLYVLKRPGLSAFLEKLAAEYEVVIFTAGLKEYASLVVDRIDPRGLISHRLYRDACREMEGRFVKDLGGIGRELKRVVLVDDNPNAAFLQPENALRVRPFVDDLEDDELGRVGRVLEGCGGVEDLRVAARRFWEEKLVADGVVMVSVEL